jgi:hypothetical protein
MAPVPDLKGQDQNAKPNWKSSNTDDSKRTDGDGGRLGGNCGYMILLD